jgi:hypothetical protein
MTCDDDDENNNSNNNNNKLESGVNIHSPAINSASNFM